MPHGPKASDNFLGGVRSGLELSGAAICGKVSAAAALNVRAPQVLGNVRAPDVSERPRGSRAFSTASAIRFPTNSCTR